MTETMPVAPAPQQMQLAVADLKAQQDLIQQAIKAVFIPGHHYGVIPGTEAKQGEKPRPPVLLKPGAEKLCSLFRLAANFDVKTKDLPGGHREERVTCTLTHILTGSVVATALGSCSTMEAKYRYRNGKPVCPSCQQPTVHKSREEFYCWAKKGGCGETFPLNDKRISEQPIGLTENRDLADTFNTVLKMAVKRAHIAAVLLATAASDAFVVEEDEDEEPEEKPRGKSGKQPDAKKPEPKQGQQQQQREEPPPTDLTPRQLLLRDCVRQHEALTAAGHSKQELIDLLGKNSVVMPAKWGDLDDKDLATVRNVFSELLKAGKPTGGGS